MATRILLRRDTADNWSSANPVLGPGEAGHDSTNNQLRVGNGESTWVELEPLQGTDVDLSLYATQVALDAESNARSDGDASLQRQINDLVIPPGYDDSAIQAALAQETKERIDGDTGLQQQLNEGGQRLVAVEGKADDLEQRVIAIEENGGGGGDPGGGSPSNISLLYTGDTFWPDDLDQGEVKIHPASSSIFMPSLDLSGFDLDVFLDEFVNKGTTFLFTETDSKNNWVHFEAQSKPTIQPWGRNIAVARIGGKFAIRTGKRVDLVIDLAHAGPVDSAVPAFMSSGDPDLRAELEHEREQRKLLEFQLRSVYSVLSKTAQSKLRGVFPEGSNEPEQVWDGGEC